MKIAPFRFKQFTVAHDKCAMKVNTDGVLLGAWVAWRLTAGKPAVELHHVPKQILDIGTGTGVLALMLAQNFHQSVVDAIDIDEAAYLQASENFEASNWRSTLKAHHSPLQNFFPEKKYNIIISNPPYFVNDLKGIIEQKNIAKHTITLNYEELILNCTRLLNEQGKLFLSIPAFNVELIQSLAQKQTLFITQKTLVKSIEGKEPYLSLLCLEATKKDATEESITIQQLSGGFTNEYKMLTGDYYL